MARGIGRIFGPATGTQMINHAGGATENYGFPNAVYTRPATPGPPDQQHKGEVQGPHFIPQPGQIGKDADKERKGAHAGTGVPEGQGRAFYSGFFRGSGR